MISRHFGVVLFVVLLVRPFAGQASAQDASIGEPAGSEEVAYLVTTPQIVRDRPELNAKAIGRLRPLDLVRVSRFTQGWLFVDSIPRGGTSPDFTQAKPIGWIEHKPDDLLQDRFGWAHFSRMTVINEPWPVTTKIDILKRRVRVGFAASQVKTALGDPLAVVSEETATGKTEVWTFKSGLYTLTRGRVTKITKVE